MGKFRNSCKRSLSECFLLAVLWVSGGRFGNEIEQEKLKRNLIITRKIDVKIIYKINGEKSNFYQKIKHYKCRILVGATLTTLSLFGIQVGVGIYRDNVTQNLLTSKIETRALLRAEQKLEKAILDKRNSDSNQSICLPVSCKLIESKEILDEISTVREILQSIKTFRPEVKPLIQKLASAEVYIFLIHNNIPELVFSWGFYDTKNLSIDKNFFDHNQVFIVPRFQNIWTEEKFRTMFFPLDPMVRTEDLVNARAMAEDLVNAKAMAETEAMAWVESREEAEARVWARVKATQGAMAEAMVEAIAEAMAEAGAKFKEKVILFPMEESEAEIKARAKVMEEAIAEIEPIAWFLAEKRGLLGSQALNEAIRSVKSINTRGTQSVNNIEEFSELLALIENASSVITYILFVSLGTTAIFSILTAQEITNSIDFQKQCKDRLSHGIREEYLGELNARIARWEKEGLPEKEILIKTNLCLLNLYRIQLYCRLQDILMGSWRGN